MDQAPELERRVEMAMPGATLIVEPDAGRYRVDGVSPDAAVIAALADWCATAGLLIVELRAVGATLEEAYLELVADGQQRERGDEPGDRAGDGDATRWRTTS
jgi:hypothetical protein